MGNACRLEERRGGSELYIDADYLNETGGSADHNNMPPYLAVHIWKRTE